MLTLGMGRRRLRNGSSSRPRVTSHQMRIAVSPTKTPTPSQVLITEAITIRAK